MIQYTVVSGVISGQRIERGFHWETHAELVKQYTAWAEKNGLTDVREERW